MQELKPSIKSLEGKVFTVVVGLCSLILSYLGYDLSSFKVDDLDGFIQVASEVSKNVDDVKEVWNYAKDVDKQYLKLGAFGSVLVFMYKLIVFYIRSRNEIKIEHLRLMLGRKEESDEK